MDKTLSQQFLLPECKSEFEKPQKLQFETNHEMNEECSDFEYENNLKIPEMSF